MFYANIRCEDCGREHTAIHKYKVNARTMAEKWAKDNGHYNHCCITEIEEDQVMKPTRLEVMIMLLMLLVVGVCYINFSRQQLHGTYNLTQWETAQVYNHITERGY